MVEELDQTVCGLEGESISASVKLPAKFVLKSLIGEGGMSRVYLAFDNTMKREVAVKVMRLQSSGEAQLEQRFQKEIKALATLEHPNIVKIFSSGFTEDGDLYLVMEYLQGSTLAEELSKNAPLGSLRLKEIFSQIIDGLQYMHYRKIVHRDLKPSNIMLCNDPELGLQVKIIDFGLVRVLCDLGSETLTKTNAVLGSPAYMSPEQCKGEKANEPADIYALGCMLYEAVSGRKPYESESSLELMHKHMYEEPKPLRFQAKGKSQSNLESLILKCLDKESKARPSPASELQSQFLSIFGEAEPDLSLEHEGKKGARSYNAGVFVLLFIILAVGFTLFYLSKRGVAGDTMSASPPGSIKGAGFDSRVRDKIRLNRIYDGFQPIIEKNSRENGTVEELRKNKDLLAYLAEARAIAGDKYKDKEIRFMASQFETLILNKIDAPLDEQLKANERALELSIAQGKETKETAQCKLNMAEIYLHDQQFRHKLNPDPKILQKVILNAKEALKTWTAPGMEFMLSKESRRFLEHNTHVDSRSYNLIACAYAHLGDYRKASENIARANEISFGIQEWSGAAMQIQGLADIFKVKRNLSEAKDLILKFEQDLLEFEPRKEKCDDYLLAFWQIGDYCRTQFPELAPSILKDGIKQSKELGNPVPWILEKLENSLAQC